MMVLKTKLTPTSLQQQAFNQHSTDQFDDSPPYADDLKKRDKVKIELHRKLTRYFAREWL